MTHHDVWQAIDNMASDLKITTSALAMRGGMNATTFNRSKRNTILGKSRWPTMQSIAKILNATRMDIDDFARYFPKNYHKGDN